MRDDSRTSTPSPCAPRRPIAMRPRGPSGGAWSRSARATRHRPITGLVSRAHVADSKVSHSAARLAPGFARPAFLTSRWTWTWLRRCGLTGFSSSFGAFVHMLKPLKLMELDADLFPVKYEALCPTCRRSLIEEVRAHLRECHAVPANVAAEAQRQRERAESWSSRTPALRPDRREAARAEAKQAELEARRRRLASDPRSAAMGYDGPPAERVYRRYAVVDETMLREAGDKLARLQELAALRRLPQRVSPPIHPSAGLQ